MSVDDEVLVYSASGTFRGQRGVVTEVIREGARVLVEGEDTPMCFTRRELVPLNQRTHMTAGG
jgi:ribosomal protein L24